MVLILPGPVPAEQSLFDKPLSIVPDALVDPGEGPDRYVVVVEKASQKLFFYQYRSGNLYLVRSFDCTTGENIGDKMVEGDKKTPEGFYIFNKKSLESELASIYGVLAYPMDYPNFWDIHNGKKGGGIWLHGTDRPRVPRDTNGCVALENIDLIELESFIRLYDTPIVIYDEIQEADARDLKALAAKVKDFIEKWRQAWAGKDFDAYESCYAEDFISNDGKDYRGWMDHKKRLLKKYARIKVALDDLRIFRHQGMIVASFNQDYRGGSNFVSIGYKRLFIRENKDGSFKIVAEVWHPLPPKEPEKFLSAQVKQRVVEDARMAAAEKARLAETPILVAEVKGDQRPGVVPDSSPAIRTAMARPSALPAPRFVPRTTDSTVVAAASKSAPQATPVPVPQTAPQPVEPPAEPPSVRETEPLEPEPIEPEPVKIASRVEAPGPVVAETPSPGQEVLTASSRPEPQESPVPTTASLDPAAEVNEAFQAWLKAWQAKDMDAYTGFYHSGFRFKDMSLAGFRKYKKKLAEKYAYIKVGVEDFNIQVEGSQVLVTFIQDYRTDTYHDRGLKILVFQKDRQDWRIMEESWQELSEGKKP